MIGNRLRIIMAENYLNIAKVHKDTGIARTTLTMIYYNEAAGIRYETLNKLCNYLKITPADFFDFAPDKEC